MNNMVSCGCYFDINRLINVISASLPPTTVTDYADFFALMPSDNAVTITPIAGGTNPTSAHLIITKI